MAAERIPSLDGLRAASILLVMLGHCSHTVGFPLHSAFLSPYADFGVRVFFVISGYLITRLLIQEYNSQGKIDLRQFYIRRVFRIFPAAYVFMTTAICWNWSTLTGTNILTAVTYTQNFSAHPQWTLGHLWSLAVEEQFYLLWPCVLAFFYGARRGILLCVICVIPLANALMIYCHSPLWGRSFFSVADTLAVGCLLAVVEDRSDIIDRVLRSRWGSVIPVFTLVSAALITLKYPLLLSAIRTLLWRPMMHFGIALSIALAIRRRYWLLNCRVMVRIGVLSYSLYLWQQLFLNQEANSSMASFPANIMFVLAAASASHYLIEKPFLKVGSRFRKRGQSALPTSRHNAAALPRTAAEIC